MSWSSWSRIAPALLTLTTIATLSGTLSGTGSRSAAQTPTAEPPTTPSLPNTPVTATPLTTPLAASPEWTFLFGGDSHLTHAIKRGVDPFAGIVPPLATADIAMVNAETSIATGGSPVPDKEFYFRSPPSFARLLHDAGVDAVSVANNHSLDFGQSALTETLVNLRSAGVAPVGAGANRAEALTPVTLFAGGVRVALLAATQVIPSGSWMATETRAGLATAGKHIADASTVALGDAVAGARATHDVVIVVLHWGIEGSPCPTPAQRSVARLLTERGATAVLGAHPHVLQPITLTRSADGRLVNVVAYSMGNFVWDPRPGATADTGVLELRFSGSAPTDVIFHPHRLDANGWAKAVDPDSDAGRRITARTTRLC